MSENGYGLLCFVGIVALVVLGLNTAIRSKRVWIAGKWATARTSQIWGWIAVFTGIVILVGYLFIF